MSEGSKVIAQLAKMVTYADLICLPGICGQYLMNLRDMLIKYGNNCKSSRISSWLDSVSLEFECCILILGRENNVTFANIVIYTIFYSYKLMLLDKYCFISNNTRISNCS
ncbi:hypothetical protein [Clostridium sp.]|uniref:hypothetical protein n=1 Tax=Clostridium sp. TaxID=1506 RepID=UPI0039F53BFA